MKGKSLLKIFVSPLKGGMVDLCILLEVGKEDKGFQSKCKIYF